MISGDMTVGELSSFLLYVVFVAASLGMLTGVYGEFMKAVGASARVCSGMSYDRVGWPGRGAANQGPGLVAHMLGWNISLSPAQIHQVYTATRPTYYGGR